MPRRQSQFAANTLRRYARQAGPKLRAMPTTITPQEQMQRFVTGAERGRLDTGEVSYGEYVDYEKAMMDRLRATWGHRKKEPG